MAEPVKSRDWRRRKGTSSTHTREVHSEHLPEGVLKAMRLMAERVQALEELTSEMAQQIANQNIRAVQTEERLSKLEAALGGLAAEAARRVASDVVREAAA